jgi:hypothetical protein
LGDVAADLELSSIVYDAFEPGHSYIARTEFVAIQITLLLVNYIYDPALGDPNCAGSSLFITSRAPHSNYIHINNYSCEKDNMPAGPGESLITTL